MTFNTIGRPFLVAVAALCIVAIGSPAHAQSKVEWVPFAKVGNWAIESELLYCRLSGFETPTGLGIEMTQMRRLAADIRVRFNSEQLVIDAETDIKVVIGDFSMKVIWNKWTNSASPPYVNRPLAEAFRRGQTLSVIVEGEEAASYSLKGSAAAFRELQNCVNQLYDGPVRPPEPAPPLVLAPPPITEPNLEGPFSANRKVQPVKPAAWFRAIDTRPHHPFNGTVRFRVVVNSLGRVTNCEITESSGDIDLDRHTCILIERRARFDPATDDDGELISSDWSSSVRWELPE